MSKFEQLGTALGQLVDEKQRAYGDAAAKSGAIMRELYPAGIPPHAYDDALLIVRVLDKLSRIAQRGVDGRDLGGESPWGDIAGYGLLGKAKDERLTPRLTPTITNTAAGEDLPRIEHELEKAGRVLVRHRHESIEAFHLRVRVHAAELRGDVEEAKRLAVLQIQVRRTDTEIPEGF